MEEMSDIRRKIPPWIRAIIAMLIVLVIGDVIVRRTVPAGVAGHDTAAIILCGLVGGMGSRIWLGGARSKHSDG
jgi:hypothetical protein